MVQIEQLKMYFLFHFNIGGIPSTGREQSFTPGGESPLVPVPHPGASIRD